VLSRLDWEHDQLLELVVEVLGVLLEGPVIPTRDEAVHRRRYHRRRGGWWAARGFRTWAERPNAGPHVGEKNKNKNMSPGFQEKKTKNLRFRVFFSSLPVCGVFVNATETR
jgi:hypothetical protein